MNAVSTWRENVITFYGFNFSYVSLGKTTKAEGESIEQSIWLHWLRSNSPLTLSIAGMRKGIQLKHLAIN